MIRDAIDARAPSDPTRVHKEPTTKEGALSNLRAFLVEGQQRRHIRSCVELTPERVPRLRGCYGWLKLSGDFLNGLGRMLAPAVKLRNSYREFFCRRGTLLLCTSILRREMLMRGRCRPRWNFTT